METTTDTVRVGSILYGFCGGYFGSNSYFDKRVEAIGADWVVARNIDDGEVQFSYDGPEKLVEYLARPEDD